jgi:hypothetical protein
MRTKDLKFHLIAILAVAGICCLHAYPSEKDAIKWNENAVGAVLTKDELGKLGSGCPSWRIKQMIWPSATEIRVASFEVDSKLKSSCMGWLKKFIKSEYLPEDLNKHLVAMKNWGLITKESEQKRLCDVFVVRFKKGSYVVHIQESLCNVVISVSDETLARDAKTDKKESAMGTAVLFLSDKLMPDPNSEDVHVFEFTDKENKITRISWLVKDIIGTRKDGTKYTDLEKAWEIGTTYVEGETDGRFVKFEIWKETKGKRAFPDPYLERFSTAK